MSHSANARKMEWLSKQTADGR